MDELLIQRDMLNEENRQLKAENRMLRQMNELCWFCWAVTLVGMLYASRFVP